MFRPPRQIKNLLPSDSDQININLTIRGMQIEIAVAFCPTNSKDADLQRGVGMASVHTRPSAAWWFCPSESWRAVCLFAWRRWVSSLAESWRRGTLALAIAMASSCGFTAPLAVTIAMWLWKKGSRETCLCSPSVLNKVRRWVIEDEGDDDGLTYGQLLCKPPAREPGDKADDNNSVPESLQQN